MSRDEVNVAAFLRYGADFAVGGASGVYARRALARSEVFADGASAGLLQAGKVGARGHGVQSLPRDKKWASQQGRARREEKRAPVKMQRSTGSNPEEFFRRNKGKLRF